MRPERLRGSFYLGASILFLFTPSSSILSSLSATNTQKLRKNPTWTPWDRVGALIKRRRGKQNGNPHVDNFNEQNHQEWGAARGQPPPPRARRAQFVTRLFSQMFYMPIFGRGARLCSGSRGLSKIARWWSLGTRCCPGGPGWFQRSVRTRPGNLSNSSAHAATW